MAIVSVWYILETENVSYTINTMLGNSIKKSESDIASIVKKPIILWEKLKKTLNDLEKLHPDFPEEGKEERSAGHVGIFCQNLGITAHTLENYSNFKSNFSFNNESILWNTWWF